MSRSVLVLAVIVLIVFGGLAVFFGPKVFGHHDDGGESQVATACKAPFFAQTGVKKVNFGGFKAGGDGVEAKGFELVNDPEVKALLNDRQNQLVLGEYFFCVAREQKEFASSSDPDLVNWYRDKFQFLATGPSADQMQAWEGAHPRPEGFHLVVSNLKAVGDHEFQLAEWSGLTAGFGISNDGSQEAPVTLQDFPRQTYMLLANGIAQAEDIVSVPAGKDVRFQLLLLSAPSGEARFKLHLAKSQIYDVAIEPPAQIAELKAQTLTAFADKLTGPTPVNADDPKAAYAAMLEAVNTVAKPASPLAANLLAGDLLASARLGVAAQSAYQVAGLPALAASSKNPELASRLATVAKLNGNDAALKAYLPASARVGESDQQVIARISDFQAVKPSALKPETKAALVFHAQKLEAAPSTKAVTSLQKQLYKAAGPGAAVATVNQ